jgi:putative membrane-bound dehydrogenase-like protein
MGSCHVQEQALEHRPHHSFVQSALCAGALAVWLSAVALPAAPAFHLPDGFTIEQVAGAPSINFPMFACFDDRGRLFVAESSGLDLYAALKHLTRRCRVSMLEDRDGDGRFETASVFADKLVFPMGLAWRDGRLYVADPPKLVTYEDTNGDGWAEKRTELLGDFGHTDNGSLHGLVFGPDGLLYMTMGEPDGYRITRADGSVLHGDSGALIRCRPDGSHPEVLCRGFINLVEVAFLPNGDVVGTDNWFTQPEGGVRDALVHLIEGGLYPYKPDSGTPYPITGEPLPAVAMFPAFALSGLECYRGAGLPAEMRGNLFSAQHNSRRVQRHVLAHEGSSYRAESFDFVTTDDPDFHPSDVLEDADGSLLVVDTGGWYVQHCPTGKIRNSRSPGGIYRVRFQEAKPLADPWGLGVKWARLSTKELVALLDDPRPAVRDAAQWRLSGKGDAAVAALAGFLKGGQASSLPIRGADGTARPTAKTHAVWALAGIASDKSRATLRELLSDTEPTLAMLAARALALQGDSLAGPALTRLLRAASPAVQRAAAEALAHCGSHDSVPGLWQALAAGADRLLQHSITHAIHALADRDELERALNQEHALVQSAALRLLDQPPRPPIKPELVFARMSSPNETVHRTALWGLRRHREWAPAAAAHLRSQFDRSSLSATEWTGLRDLILTFQKETPVQEQIGALLTADSARAPAEPLAWLLETLSLTSLPMLPASWLAGLRRALSSSSAVLQAQAVRTVAVLQVPQLDEELARLAGGSATPGPLRLDALRALVPRRPRLSNTEFDFLLTQLSPQADPPAQLAAAQVFGQVQLSEDQLAPLLQALRASTLVSPSTVLAALLKLEGPSIEPIYTHLAEAVRNGWRPTEAEWTKISARLPEKLRPYADSLAAFLKQERERAAARLAEFEPLLSGGEALRGRDVFLSPKTACGACHRVGAEGGRMGPDLTKIGAFRSGRDLLESILLPSSTFAQGYEPWSVVTHDGRELDGVIARQNGESIVLRDASGAETLVRRDQLKQMDRRTSSLMPEGLEQAMTREELRDLLGFLQSLK